MVFYLWINTLPSIKNRKAKHVCHSMSSLPILFVQPYDLNSFYILCSFPCIMENSEKS